VTVRNLPSWLPAERVVNPLSTSRARRLHEALRGEKAPLGRNGRAGPRSLFSPESGQDPAPSVARTSAWKSLARTIPWRYQFLETLRGEAIGFNSPNGWSAPSPSRWSLVHSWDRYIPGAADEPKGRGSRRVAPTGRGAAWLACLLWEQEVGGSNPPAPTVRR
jgi:hypothetical protein